FMTVYFLGNKGFCTYACPYGGVFGLVDKVAPGRIRVTDACEECGHCTAVCTSNVIVHAEVKKYGMVVDPGCMKCMDCVSVCPNDAHAVHALHAARVNDHPVLFNLGVDNDVRGADGRAMPALLACVRNPNSARSDFIDQAEHAAVRTRICAKSFVTKEIHRHE